MRPASTFSTIQLSNSRGQTVQITGDPGDAAVENINSMA